MENPQRELADVSNFPNVRFMTVGREGSPEPKNDLPTRALWGPTTAGMLINAHGVTTSLTILMKSFTPKHS